MSSTPDQTHRVAVGQLARRNASAPRLHLPSQVAAAARYAAVLAILLLASGCQRTLLSQAPASGTGCDSDLVGYWVSLGKDDDPDGEIEATLSSDCIVSVTEHRKDGPRVWPPVKLASARVAGRDLLWLDATATNAAYQIEPEAIDREASVYVFAYQVRRDRLTMLQPDHRRLARQVVDGELDGAVLMEGQNIVVRLDGDTDELAGALGKRASFQRDEALRFRRGTPSTPR